jgi:1-deoxy-D-xylulose-5-phosphate reductoisomerase
MKIPISNTLYGKSNIFSKKTKISLKNLNEASFYKVNNKKFPSIKLVSKIHKSGYSAPIIINASNEILVSLFLKGKLGFLDLVKTINHIIKEKDFKKYAKRKPKSVKDIKIIDNWARLKTASMCAI